MAHVPAHPAATFPQPPSPGAVLVEFPEYGHSPQLEAPEVFNAALLDALAKPTAAR